MTYELGPGAPMPEINEDHLLESAPRVRWQTVQRYEDLYRVVAAHVKEADDGERPLDPRYLEIGIRILKEESLLYRLGRPPAPQSDDDDPSVVLDAAAQVEAQLVELEARAAGSD